MKKRIDRRTFLQTGVTASLGAALSARASAQEAARKKTVRVGVVGTGNRGTHLMRTAMNLEEVAVPALCDINPQNLAAAQAAVQKTGRPKPEGYAEGETAYEKLMARDDLDAVLIATPWQWHTPMAVSAMKNGKYVAVEVPAALTVEECWQLVDTSEQTKIPCMMLENWSFRRDNLAVLNMIRRGLLGDIVHCHCAHSHDCLRWFFDAEGNMRWGGEFLVKRNCDQYPTHSLGPVLSWMDINCGDNYDHLTSVATDSKGINDYFRRTFGPDHPNAKRKYKQGDIVTTLIRTHGGRSIVVNYDMQLPRPYDNRWMIQGTLGIYNEQRDAVHLAGKNAGTTHSWEPFAPHQKRHEHAWWKEGAKGGHGGTDYLELKLFVEAVRNGTQTPIDVYDSASMSCIVGLSEESIANGSRPVKCPDFTRGKWKARKPTFGIVG